MNYKKTLLMPKADFDMRGNLTSKDPLFIKKEVSENIYNKLKVKNQDNPTFILHDGPPYANGNIHLGHALNKIIKDIIVRQKALDKFNVEWIFGWDTHGLPIEVAVQKEGEVDKTTPKEIALKKFRNYALKQQQKQAKDFQKLALFTDYDKRYLTLENNFVASEIEIFFMMQQQGLVYRDLKPVYWSWSSKTALAEAEVEYKDVVSNAIYVEFQINKDLNALIWTTTPWTLFANTAIAFGKDIKYSIYSANDKKYVLADELVNGISEQSGLQFTFVESFDVKQFINSNAINPVNELPSKIVYGHHVTIDAGTGIVHVAGGHGEDDYIISKEYDLELKVVLNDDGTMKNALNFDGKFYKDAESQIIESLKQDNKLFYSYEFEHSYPHDWRTKKPIVFMATKQWFVSLVQIKDKLLSSIKDVKWEPKWGEKRLTTMIEDRKDWCISRQRSWGVPIPIIFDENNQPIINEKLNAYVVEKIRENGTYWWSSFLLEEAFKELGLPYNENYSKEVDILDVWFDSGSSHYALYPKDVADLYVEGNDQYRGWFNSSLITGVVSKQKSPYKAALTHGFTIDKNGQKMSKSLGNIVDPLDIVKKNGIDILRLWVVNSDFKDNLKYSDEILEQSIKDYKKIRNTLRFVSGNLKGYDKTINVDLSKIDKMILAQINKMLKVIKEKNDDYQFNLAYRELVKEVMTGSIAFYLDYAKDFLYTYAEGDKERLSVQYVLSVILDVLFYTLTPFIPVTMDELLSKVNLDIESPMLMTFDFEYLQAFEEFDLMEEFIQIRNLVNKEIEVLKADKLVSNSLEVLVDLHLTKDSSFTQDANILKQALMVSKVSIQEANEFKVSIKTSNELVKCDRCWKYFEKDDMHNEHLCVNCKRVLYLNRDK